MVLQPVPLEIGVDQPGEEEPQRRHPLPARQARVQRRDDVVANGRDDERRHRDKGHERDRVEGDRLEFGEGERRRVVGVRVHRSGVEAHCCGLFGGGGGWWRSWLYWQSGGERKEGR